jgi:hypothetical protein
MATYYIDPQAGSDTSGNGSEASPWASFLNVNTGNLWKGNNIRQKRGTTMLPASANHRANIDTTAGSGSGRCILNSYGDSLAADPIVDGYYAIYHPIWVRGGNEIDIADLHVTRSYQNGFLVSPLDGKSVDDVTLTRLYATANGERGQSGAACTGIFVTRQTGGLSCTNVITRDCVVEDNGGHGIKYADCATGKVLDSRATRCGLWAPGHGMGTIGAYVLFDSNAGWTNVSGNIWSINVSAKNNGGYGAPTASQDVTTWLLVTAGDDASMQLAAQAQLTRSATPATPGANEFGINGTNTLLVNLNGIDPRTIAIKAVYSQPSVLFQRCIAEYTVNFDGPEGPGFQFDDGTVGCAVRNNISRYNEGAGIVSYGGIGNVILQNAIYGNGSYGIRTTLTKSASIVGNTVAGNAAAAFSNHKGIGTQIRRNVLMDHAIGFSSNSNGNFPVTEDENLYYNITTLRSNVSAGAKTRQMDGRRSTSAFLNDPNKFLA